MHFRQILSHWAIREAKRGRGRCPNSYIIKSDIKMHFMLVHAWPVKTIRSCTDMKISKNHTQSLRPKAKLSVPSKSYMRLHINSNDTKIAWNISNISFVPFRLKKKRYFQGATFTSLKVNLTVTIRRHPEPSLLMLRNSTGIKTRLVQKQWNWLPCASSRPVLALLPDPPQCRWQGPRPPTWGRGHMSNAAWSDISSFSPSRHMVGLHFLSSLSWVKPCEMF